MRSGASGSCRATRSTVSDEAEGSPMSVLAAAFNRSGFARFLNSPGGRVFRVVAGTGFLVLGLFYREQLLGILSLVWSFFPLTAGAFDVCYISAALGGPFTGKKIRGTYQTV
jgi:hypothetical protein